MKIRERIEELEKHLETLKEAIKETEDNRPITERVKTFEDAVAILGKNHPFVTQLERFNGLDPTDAD